MAIETHVAHDIHVKREARAIDAAIAALARRQHGVVARSQLTDMGLGRGAIEHRIALERLQLLHTGVYAVGHSVLRREGWWLAAVLAAGPGTALSHRSAAELWGLLQTSRARIEVSAPRNRRSTDRLELHCIEMELDEVRREGVIPVTTPARTLFDLAAVVSRGQLEHAFNEAEYRRLSSPTSLDALLARYPRRRGTANLRRVLEKHRQYGETRTRSDLERHFLALIDAHGLPRPKINRETDHGELDATWREERLVVEVDGWAGHGTRRAFEDDRARDRDLVVAGWRVVRLTWRQLTTDADTIATQLSVLLGATPKRRSARRAHRPPRRTPATRSAVP